MELLRRTVGPIATNVYVLGDEATREALAVDTATPSAAWLTEALAERGWTLKLIVSSHRHWDHIGDNAAVMTATGAQLAAHILDRPGIERPEPIWAPFPIPPSVPAVDLAEGGLVRFGSITLSVLHTPGHTEGSVCLLARDERTLVTGDTLFAGGWGRVDLPGGSAEQMVESLGRLSTLEDDLRVLPGHGPETTIARERAWLEMVAKERRLLL
jgi:glyoxylase-like metal-dependent hydrolase (beta-lactamase superfamily II)